MIVTDDSELAERLRRLRHQGMSLSDFTRHGMSPTVFESYPEIGYNYRITDIQAGIGLAQLDRLDDISRAAGRSPIAISAARQPSCIRSALRAERSFAQLAELSDRTAP